MEEENKYCYEYPRPAVTTDCVIFGWDGRQLKVLLVERGREPFQGCWALPGGFLEMDEDTETCARRELEEETGLKDIPVWQLGTFSAVKRDPRYRVISVAYCALLPFSACKVRAGDDAAKVRWFPLEAIPELAFDHRVIFQTASGRLKKKSLHYPMGWGILSDKFSMAELQLFYEALRQTSLDFQKFSHWILDTGVLEEVPENNSDISGQKIKYYCFNREKYEMYSLNGFSL